MADQISIVVARPSQPAERVLVEPTLEAFQAIVEGFLEACTPSFLVEVPGVGFPVVGGERPLHAYVNEDGKALQLAPNYCDRGDVIRGAVVVTCFDDDGDDVGLSDEQVARVVEILDAVRREQRLLPTP